MTKPQSPARNSKMECALRPVQNHVRQHGPIIAVLALALVLRLHGVGFGLPSLNDPDEPLFVLTALDMLARGSLDPRWFGHPGTTTLYGLMLVIVGVGTVGAWTGRFADSSAFASAVFLDPGIVFLPGRLFIVANGVICVWLVYRTGAALWGRREGLLAALILAVNAVHVSWSQVIRTDVQASVFMQLCILGAIAIAQKGRMRDHLASGLFAGLAIATKWPATLILLGPLCAAAWYDREHREGIWRIGVVPVVALVTLLVVSPYLLLDYPTLLRDLAGEARAVHPGATGHGFLDNLAWYVQGPLLASLGIAGTVLAIGGAVLAGIRNRAWLIAVCPGYLAFALVISAQNLIWERWLIPLLPFLALGAAWSLSRLLTACMRAGFPRKAKPVLLVVLLGAVISPMVLATRTRAIERANDTRQIAAGWIIRNVRPGATILVEHASFDLLQHGYRMIFPLGSAGCVDAEGLLRQKFSYSRVEASRQQAPVIDLGHVEASKLDTCRADYAVLSHYQRYADERHIFPEAYAKYRQLIGGARLLGTVRAVPGSSSGPVMHIFHLNEPRHAALSSEPE